MGRKPITKIGTPMSSGGVARAMKRDVDPDDNTITVAKRDPEIKRNWVQEQVAWLFSVPAVDGAAAKVPADLVIEITKDPATFKKDYAATQAKVDKMTPEQKKDLMVLINNVRTNLDTVAGKPKEVYVMYAIIAALSGILLYKTFKGK